MLELATRCARQKGVHERLRFQIADVQALPYADGIFDAVVALGVIPWVQSPLLAFREMARVLNSEGYLITSTDNRGRLSDLLDPLLNPWLKQMRYTIREQWLKTAVSQRPLHRMHSVKQVGDMLDAAGLENVKANTIGFGPFSICKRELLPDAVGKVVNRGMQALADRGIPPFDSRGSQYLVLARKLTKIQDHTSKG
jgi:ubiquinone/menaquinone biosynthesis C-methylase UbiE